MRGIFRLLAETAAHAVGSYWAFLLALLAIVVWALTGAYFNYRHVAAFHQHRNNDRYILDGLSHPEHPEPRDKNYRLKARRTAAWC